MTEQDRRTAIMTDQLFHVVVFEVPLGGGQSHDHEVPMKSLMNFEVPILMKLLFKNEVPCEVVIQESSLLSI